MVNVIETYQLEKTFKTETAVKPMNFVLEQGEICAIIGKNGAGKSTFFKMLSGQMKPTSGEMTLFGKTGEAVNMSRQRMGFMVEVPEFFPDFTARQNLEYFRIQRGVVEKERIQEVLEIVDLAHEKKKKFRDYSMGMKQRLGISLCLLSSPDCIVLDEPINGLDAEGIREVRKLLLKLNEEKQITVLVSSHILAELQLLAKRFVFIKNGVIVDDLSQSALTAKSQKQLYLKVDDTAKTAQLLERSFESIEYKVLPNQQMVIQNYIDASSDINRLLIEHDIAVHEFRVDAINLEEYFLEFVEGSDHD